VSDIPFTPPLSWLSAREKTPLHPAFIMQIASNAAVLFDLSTLATIRRLVTEEGGWLLGLRRDARVQIATLHANDIRAGVVARSPDLTSRSVTEFLRATGLSACFDTDLVVAGPDLRALLDMATVRATSSRVPSRLLFVTENAWERLVADSMGMLTAPHPRLVLPVLRGSAPLRYLRIRVPVEMPDEWSDLLARTSFVPLHRFTEPWAEGKQVGLYGIADAETAAQLDDLGFWVDRLGEIDEPQLTTLHLLRDDVRQQSEALVAGGHSSRFFSEGKLMRHLLASTPDGLLVALPAGYPIEKIHFRNTAHGHNRKLAPTLALLDRRASAPSSLGEKAIQPGLASGSLVPPWLVKALDGITEADLEKEVKLFSGARAFPDGTLLKSRDVANKSCNDRAVFEIEKRLCEIDGLVVQRIGFTHDPGSSASVSAENIEARLPAKDDSSGNIVIISAHIDSTAIESPPYSAASDDAPGADDDASGIAGVLGAARVCSALRDQKGPRSEIRFLFFNAEEPGKYGSLEYARGAADMERKENIIAVFQMDMIGFVGPQGPVVELHAGCEGSDQLARDSERLAKLVDAIARELFRPEQLSTEVFSGGTKEDDPGLDRSDHYSFHSVGYPACWITEDFFPNTNHNPEYHKDGDRTVDGSFAARIARCVTAAAWLMATQ
jgi:leucyl aminopeptidase